MLTVAIEALRGRLGPEAFDVAVAEGRSLSFQEAVNLIRDLLNDAMRTAPSAETRQSGPLSPREDQVLRLMAEGLANREIGGRLHISEGTVKYHVAGIYNKLGVDSRAEAIATAARMGIL